MRVSLTIVFLFISYQYVECEDYWWLKLIQNHESPWTNQKQNLGDNISSWSPNPKNSEFAKKNEALSEQVQDDSVKPVSEPSESDDSNLTALSNKNEPCECVMYYQCRSTGEIIDDGTDLVDFRSTKRCPNHLEVCCRIPKDDETSTKEPGNKPKPKPAPLTQCGSSKINYNFINWKVRNKIMGDKSETVYGQYPWTLALTKTEEGLFAFVCGASLIHPKVAMTAAHCVQDERDLSVRAGEWDSRTESEPLPFQTRKVIRLIEHPEASLSPPRSDIALLELDAPFEMADNINIICLPEEDDDFTDQMCIATGWGKNNFEDTSAFSTSLKKVELPIMDRLKCRNALRKSRLGKFFKLHESFICAGGQPKQDTCTGDGGGPLFHFDPEQQRYIQVGITAWGIGCGEYPGVYTNVPYFRTWIDEKLKEVDEKIRIDSEEDEDFKFR